MKQNDIIQNKFNKHEQKGKLIHCIRICWLNQHTGMLTCVNQCLYCMTLQIVHVA